MTRYRVHAWGSDTLPPFEYETDEYPTELAWQSYSRIDIMRLDPMPLASLKQAIKDHGR